jgi:hypothetical protein
VESWTLYASGGTVRDDASLISLTCDGASELFMMEIGMIGVEGGAETGCSALMVHTLSSHQASAGQRLVRQLLVTNGFNAARAS